MKNTRNIKRQQIKEILARSSPWDLSGSADEIYKKLKDTENAYLDDYNNVDILEICWEWECSHYNDDAGEFVLTITRLENDKEYNARVKNLKSEKEKQEERERKQYMRLKEKYGDI